MDHAQNTIVIVGAGFCGTVLAANLLRRPSSDATDIVLIERGSAGRIDSVIAAGEQLRVSWRPRGCGSATLTVDLIVNATGPDYVLKRGAVPLLRDHAERLAAHLVDRRVEWAPRSRQPL